MRLKKLVIENYKSFQFPTEISFPDKHHEKSIFLIGGMNGAGKTSVMEAIHFCLYGGKAADIFRNINRTEKAHGNANVMFELTLEQDDHSELLVRRTWTTAALENPEIKDLLEHLIVVKDGKRISAQNKQMWQDFIRAKIPPSITQFFFFDGEKIQEIAADDHSEVRLKSSLEAALGIQYITRLSSDMLHIKQEERKGFVEISDEDLDFKESELKREKSKLARLNSERDDLHDELVTFKHQYNEAKKRFQATFQAEPESQQSIRQSKKKRIQTSNRLGQLDNEIKSLSESFLPFAIAGKLFDGM